MTPESKCSSMDPQIVGNAFVQKYYTHLYESPAEVHRFYLEKSVVGRPDLANEMVSVKSLKAISEKIMSYDYQNSKILIHSADSQPSIKDGVVTIVTGLVIGKDGERKTFAQTFFLVPKKGSYFVLNDVLRYLPKDCAGPESTTKKVEEGPQVIESNAKEVEEMTQVVESNAKQVEESRPQVIESNAAEPVNEIVEAVAIIPSKVTKPVSAEANGHAKVHEEKAVDGKGNLPKAVNKNGNLPKAVNKAVNGNGNLPKGVNGNGDLPKAVNDNGNLPKAAEAKPQEDAPKRSYALIQRLILLNIQVQSLAQNSAPFIVKAAPAKPKPVEKPRVAAPEPKAPAPVAKRASVEQAPQGVTIFVGNLPIDATHEQLDETFRVFGAIREGGIQVRSYTETRNCFGFVSFMNGEAVKKVLEAQEEYPIIIGNRRAHVEEKRGNNNENDGRASARSNGNNRDENGHRNTRGNGSNGGRSGQGRNGETTTGAAKASQIKGHGNGQARK
ncbi:unnamed protein product [Thlaspi arvense]|uniref:Uncharacterized protein n=1 Tax=Thlaspi arvense TaxID=13288 RepID=A0AAU9RM09_THLAR|nr:unnamed protein product [Thlaspi arvense]